MAEAQDPFSGVERDLRHHRYYRAHPRSRCWRGYHAGAFMLGGLLFIIGTCFMIPRNWTTGLTVAAVLYTVGSLSFLSVDLQEFFTLHGSNHQLTLNIFVSVMGSILYVLGSVGFFPQVNMTDLCMWGFVLGSALIGSSELWKLYRVGTTSQGFALSHYFASDENFAAMQVEVFACLGAWLYLIGTILFDDGKVGRVTYDAVIVFWLVSSVCFFLAACFLMYRHMCLHV